MEFWKDVLNYKSNSRYDSLINRLVNNELDQDEAIMSMMNNEFSNESTLNNQSTEYFVNYFINSLHLSSSWIINSTSQNRSVASSPVKLKTVPVKIAPDVKRNLFDLKCDPKPDARLKTASSAFSKFEKRFNTSSSSPTKQQPKFDTKAVSAFKHKLKWAKQHKQNERNIENLNLKDDESFPQLNNQKFIKTTSAEGRSSGQKSSQKQRRINPTRTDFIETDKKNNLRKSLFEKNRKIFDEAPELEQKDTPRDGIKMMAKEISAITPKKNATVLLVRTPNKIQDQTIQPNLNKVTVDKDKFDNLIHFYSNLIEQNLISNVLVEIDFLVQLATKRCSNENSGEFLAAFEFCSNYHNCVYFAVRSLEKLFENTLVNYFDEQFFKVLSSNESIKRMVPAFRNKLLACEKYLINEDQMQDLSSAVVPAFDFIAYQPETDSQENFPNDQTFHLFRRQRDAFFKLYYEWKQVFVKKCFKQDSIFNDQEFKFIHKVTFIFSLSKDFANYFHLARLFLAQLMQCCTGQNATNAEQTINELIKQKATTNQSTPNVCENKMKKLNKRFNQQDQKVMATQSSFTGEEIFFFDFITACNNYSFLTILQSLLISKINELNNPNLLIEAIELDENNLEIASYFCTNLLNLQLLAKFLGLIVFMPYYSKMNGSSSSSTVAIANKNNDLNEMIKNIHTEETSLCKMINQMIINSMERKHLISTIPWIIQFLNQMDPNTTDLTNYDLTFNRLIDIYHELGLKSTAYQMDKMNNAYLKLVFGNFFEKYFLACHAKLFEVSSTKILATCIDPDSARDKTLDSFQLINKKFLNACFPKLFVIKEMVKQNSTAQSIENYRKIKPLSLPLNESFTTNISNTPAKVDKKNVAIQIEYEENFFRLHAESLRKTVEFVADRLHSKCIKSLRLDVIKRVKKDTFAAHDDLSKTMTILDQIRQECLKFIKEFADQKVSEAIDLLVSEHDFSENTIRIAKSIAQRMYLDKCLNWMYNNVNDSWVINETLIETTRRQQGKQNSIILEQVTDQRVPNISKCFNSVRDFICDLLFKNESDCTKEQLHHLIDELKIFRNPASNLPARTNQVIETTMMDLIVALLANQPKRFDSELIQKIVSFYVDNRLAISKFISSRNFLILSQSKDAYSTWDKYESILLRFMQKDIYTVQSLESDVLSVLGNQNEWSKQSLAKLASCIKSAVDFCKSHEKYKDYKEKIELVDWLSWFCGQSDEFDQ